MPQDTKAMLVDRYYALCDKRDATNEAIKPLQVELDKTNAAIEVARLRALDLKAEIEAERDGPAWLTLKNEIMLIASALRKIPPRSAA